MKEKKRGRRRGRRRQSLWSPTPSLRKTSKVRNTDQSIWERVRRSGGGGGGLRHCLAVPSFSTAAQVSFVAVLSRHCCSNEKRKRERNVTHEEEGKLHSFAAPRRHVPSRHVTPPSTTGSSRGRRGELAFVNVGGWEAKRNRRRHKRPLERAVEKKKP
ncbi:hypothetical protein PIB30_002990 [Stylosanthes scabra]|uniref:Uncharacterized protein n=1 Tax=Stylosanthes scabra TaxID=79078 RepID=A0ABU6W193_9FABA|nr:hypothetical protein [Stylosanthes scabra]